MPHPIKIATCSYCGRRTVLRLTARHGHALACGSCGAPLQVMKAMKVAAQARPAPKRAPSGGIATPGRSARKPKKGNRRKGFWTRALEEAFDTVEDVFEAVEDIFD